jgi:glycosyltransferase involved in cell wall biosynthesis
MRILKVTQAYYPFFDKGGPVVKVRALATELARRGHEVTVVTSDLGMERSKEARNIAKVSRWGWEGRPDGIETLYLRSFGRYRALTFNPDVVAFCRERLQEFNLVHVYGLYDLLGPSVAHFCRRMGIAYVVEPMGMYRPIDRNFQMKRLWHWTVGGRFWRKAERVVATSEIEYDELRADGVTAERLVMRYNGIDSDLRSHAVERGDFRNKWKIPGSEWLVLFLGRLIPRKGADVLIDAFAEAHPRSGSLVIAGPEGERGYRSYLEQRARKRSVESRVVFTGPLYGVDKREAFADADVFALPSRYENFANSAAEAIACGVPAVVTGACGIGSLVKDKAGLVIAPGKEALVEALHRLATDASLYRRLKGRCDEVAGGLSWPHLAAQMESHYGAALAMRNGVH